MKAATAFFSLIGAVSLVTLVACIKKKPESDVNYSQRVDVLLGNSMGTPGHEVLTWLALYNLQDLDKNFFSLPEKAFTKAGNSDNPILIGNFATDLPKGVMTHKSVDFPGLLFQYLTQPPLGVSRYRYQKYIDSWNAPETAEKRTKYKTKKEWSDDIQANSWGWTEWIGDGGLTPLHFMRDGSVVDNSRGKIVSLSEACSTSHEVIRTAFHKALNLLHDDENALNQYERSLTHDERLTEAKMWLGSATHTIQDSFSPAHTYRDGGMVISNADLVTDIETHQRKTCEGGSCQFIRAMCSSRPSAEDTEYFARQKESNPNFKEPDVCRHPSSLSGEHDEDKVFEDWDSRKITFNIEYHMRPLAKEAVEASVRYLETFYAIAFNGKSEDLLEGFLNDELSCCEPGTTCGVPKGAGAMPRVTIKFPEKPLYTQ